MTFGYKCGWFAVRTRSSDRVATTFLTRPTSIDLDAGCREVYRGGIFVTRPERGWVLVGSNQFESVDDVRDQLEQLSRTFGEAQFFTSDRVIGRLGFARAKAGAIVRAFHEVDGEEDVDEGKPARDENAAFAKGRDEDGLMTLARTWSVDPTKLRGHSTGLVEAPEPKPPATPARVPAPCRLAIGKRAPAFSLGGTRLSHYAGKPVVLVFYPNRRSQLWMGATNVLEAFQCALSRFERLGAVVIGICDDANTDHRTSHEVDVDFCCLVDRQRKAIDAYGAWGESWTRTGSAETNVLRSTVLIDAGGKVRRIWRDHLLLIARDAREHVNEVVAAVRGLER